MISVIVPTLNDEHRLASALAPLVPAAMEGLVRELIICDGGSTDATFEIADDAGARFLKLEGEESARIAEGAKMAKGPWLLVLDPCVRLDFGWEQAALKHMNARKAPGRFRLQKSDGGFWDALFPPKARAVLILIGGSAGGRGVGHGVDGRRYDGVGQAHLLDARGWV